MIINVLFLIFNSIISCLIFNFTKIRKDNGQQTTDNSFFLDFVMSYEL